MLQRLTSRLVNRGVPNYCKGTIFAPVNYLSTVDTNDSRHPIDNPSSSDDVMQTISLATANQKEITKFKIRQKVEQLQQHKLDTGSSSVQIAVMTEKIINMTRHFAANRKDKGSTRSFQILVARRRKMMQYLKRKDFLTFTKTVALLNLQKEASQLSK